MNCLDCLNCKYDARMKVLYCIEKQWVKEDGTEKKVQLNRQEAQVHSLKIHPRVIFQTAKICRQFDSVDD